jgi:hypothetical protein
MRYSAIMRLRRRRLILSEDSGGYRTDWYCEPPPFGQPFQVLDNHWSLDALRAVRSIRRVQLVPQSNEYVIGDLLLKVDLHG